MATGAQQNEQGELKLEAILPDRFALKWQHATVCTAFVVLFLWLSYLPIPTSTTWHDVWQGELVDAQSASPGDTVSIRLPLAAGMRNFEIPRTGYWIVAQINEHFGSEGLSLGFCFLQTLCACLWAWLLVRVSGRWWTSLIPPVVMLLPIFDIGLTTSVLGGLCLVTTLLVMTGKVEGEVCIRISRLSWTRWIATVATFLVWANVDHSVLFGWLVLFCLLAGQVIRQIRTGPELFSDIELKSRLILLESSVAISLVNPKGIALWKSLLWYPDNPLLLAYGGFQPLVISGLIGFTVATAAMFWIYCSRFKEKIPVEFWLIPMVALATVSLNRSLVSFWLLPVVWVSLAMLNRPAFQQESRTSECSGETTPLRFGFSLVCLLVLWLGFVLSPFAHHALGGEGRSEQQRLGKSNPTAAMAFLAEANHKSDSPPLLFSPRAWSHQCLLTIDRCNVFATPQRHRIPEQANVDYEIIFGGQNGWRKLLDRYTVDIVLVDKLSQKRLVHNLRAKPGDWKRIYEDPVAIIWSKGTDNEK